MYPTTHPSNNVTFTPPEGVPEEEVMTIKGTILEEDGKKVVMTFWKPHPDELKLLNEGHDVVLIFHTDVCPVHAVAVATKE